MSGTASSLTRLSNDRAVSASTGATAYERCGDDLQCEYFAVRTGSDDEFPLSVPPGSMLDISPRGDWAVARADDGTFLLDVESGNLVPLEDGAIDANSWAPEVAQGFDKESSHRALSDIRDSIAELAYYRESLFDQSVLKSD